MTTSLDPWLEQILTRAENLPSLPAVALEVLRLCRAEGTTLDDLARALSLDPALAARILRFANSALYGSSEEVRTLQRATLVLGMKTVQLMSLAFSLGAAVPREGATGRFDYRQYWRRSLVRAVSAHALASRVGLPAQEELFLAGLLGEIGQVVLARCLDSAYDPVLQSAATRRRGWPSAELERERLGFDHGEVASALLRSWQLPGPIVLAVRHRMAPEGLPSDTPAELVPLVHALALADHATDLLTLDGGAHGLEFVHSLARERFRLDDAEVREFLLSLEDPLRETAELLELDLAPGRRHEAILEEARAALQGCGMVEVGMGEAREHETRRATFALSQRTLLLADAAHIDASTGLANEIGFRHGLEHEIRGRQNAARARPLGLLALAIVAFEQRSGAESRAAAESALAEVLLQLARRSDLCARLAPGRFALLLADASPFGSRALAERIQHEIAAREPRPPLGVSIGGACLGRARTPADGTALCEVVERLLARALQQGPGRSEIQSSWIQRS